MQYSRGSNGVRKNVLTIIFIKQLFQSPICKLGFISFLLFCKLNFSCDSFHTFCTIVPLKAKMQILHEEPLYFHTESCNDTVHVMKRYWFIVEKCNLSHLLLVALVLS